MKISKEEAIKELDTLVAEAKKRMSKGIEKYGEDLILESESQDLFDEFYMEIADALNYIAFSIILFKRKYKTLKEASND